MRSHGDDRRLRAAGGDGLRSTLIAGARALSLGYPRVMTTSLAA